MDYRQFLLIMLAEIGLFTFFVVAGVLARKRPAKHRAMMLLAGLSILAGATVRMPFLFPIFGESGRIGIFGPIFTVGAAFLLARRLLIGSFDRWFAAGYAGLVVLTLPPVHSPSAVPGTTWRRHSSTSDLPNRDHSDLKLQARYAACTSVVVC